MTEAKLFQGLINHPVPAHSREFVLAQTDRKKAFQKEMIKNIKHNQTKERVFLLSKRFVEEGHANKNETAISDAGRPDHPGSSGCCKESGKVEI